MNKPLVVATFLCLVPVLACKQKPVARTSADTKPQYLTDEATTWQALPANAEDADEVEDVKEFFSKTDISLVSFEKSAAPSSNLTGDDGAEGSDCPLNPKPTANGVWLELRGVKRRNLGRKSKDVDFKAAETQWTFAPIATPSTPRV